MDISPEANTSSTRLATRLAFLLAGFAMACWAPLVPYVKARLGLDEGSLGLLLLCIGIGSVTSMPVTGGLVGRLGCRPVIAAGAVGLCLALPVLGATHSVVVAALALLLFGACLGAVDVAMNVHAVEVERAASSPLMSGFHGLFSLGGFAGAGGMTILLYAGLSPLAATGIAVLLIGAALSVAAPRLLHKTSVEEGPLWVFPRGFVLLLGVLCFITFLTEGAILDWSALLLTSSLGFGPAEGGWGYAVFSVAMTLGRLTGDRVVSALGRGRILVLGGCLTSLGFACVLYAPVPILSLAGFALVGLGASNLVPVLFSAAGRQTVMPSGQAIAAITTIGYAGILTGPAMLGGVAQHYGLPATFLLLAGLMLAIPLSARAVAR